MGFILRFSKFSFRGAKKRFPSTDCCYNDFRGLLESPVVMQWLTLTAEEISDTLWRGKRRLFAHFDHLSPRIWSFQPISKNASQALLLCCCVMSHVTSFPLIERTHDEKRVFLYVKKYAQRAARWESPIYLPDMIYDFWNDIPGEKISCYIAIMLCTCIHISPYFSLWACNI